MPINYFNYFDYLIKPNYFASNLNFVIISSKMHGKTGINMSVSLSFYLSADPPLDMNTPLFIISSQIVRYLSWGWKLF